ncbi:YceI family protein [Limnobacter humi]|uniref:YceI family protein n=1 Tax=Limnobacter humi TaxID=1778671 RepID=A0ABT1WGW6_9BURK|nr:YceI family protein [Limnobacter humi]MCQ8895674.1 YceI family protein [Limnobacter humi]
MAAVLTVAGMLVSGVAQADPVDPAQSLVRATFKQFNVPVSGDFKKFSGQVDFNAAKPEATKATVTVQTASFDLGDPLYNKEVAKPDWFDSAKFPDATFSVTSVKPAGKGYQATGDLTIRGIKKPLTFPVSIQSQGGKSVFSGQTKIKRLDFKVGASGEWADTSLVADEVVIGFKLVTTGK